ncbi:MAG: 50S ribosomal protein L3 N(5)-glutamine methyltransferase [Gammaproteobacteria bacterium]|nr:50S ribosomal protein L3 N(5)-glutamine methyltransferase [Gammaproteobacteria bacterium]
MEQETSFASVLRDVHRRFAAAPLSYGHGTGNAWDEAVALILGVTGLRDARSSLDARLEEEQAATIRNLAERRVKERRPLAYLLGRAPYCGEPFHVPEGIVVPRSPIGPLLTDGLRPWVESPARILDLCCGSGCLGILAAKRFPNASVVLADIDPLAVSTARRNVAAHGLEHRVEALQSDLFCGLHAGGSATGARYDLILCNPPYVDANSMETLPPEFALEPALGLDGGSDGLALMNRVIGDASAFLAGQGILIGEVGEGARRLEARWPGVPFFWPDLPAGGTGVFLLHADDAP